MVYQLATTLGAGLTVKSVVGQGSTFTVLLPVRASKAPTEESPAVPDSSSQAHPGIESVPPATGPTPATAANRSAAHNL